MDNNKTTKNEGSDIGDEGKSAEKKTGETASGETTCFVCKVLFTKFFDNDRDISHMFPHRTVLI